MIHKEHSKIKRQPPPDCLFAQLTEFTVKAILPRGCGRDGLDGGYGRGYGPAYVWALIGWLPGVLSGGGIRVRDRGSSCTSCLIRRGRDRYG